LIKIKVNITMNKIIELNDVFYHVRELPDWCKETKMCIYKITNKLNGKGYVGACGDFLTRMRTGQSTATHFGCYKSPWHRKNRLLYKALYEENVENFTVEVIKEDLKDNTELNYWENYYIKYFHTYCHDNTPPGPGYNMTEGKCGSPESIDARTRAGLKVLNEKYHLNGANPNGIKAMREALHINYPDTNGVPPQNTRAWNIAGREGNKRKHPEMNGMSYKCLLAGVKSQRITQCNHIKRCFELLKEQMIKDGEKVVTAKSYEAYKALLHLGGAPNTKTKHATKKYGFKKFFSDCEKFNIDTSGIIDIFPEDWTHF
jgi:hypothetical protein